MQAAKATSTSKQNLLLCFDAFGTLFAPNTPIPTAYARAAARHGIKVDGSADGSAAVAAQFKRAFREESARNPNYGKASGLGADKWWGNVRLAPLLFAKQALLWWNNLWDWRDKIIRNTFRAWLEPGQEVPQALTDELLTRYATKEGYDVFDDVGPFFKMLRDKAAARPLDRDWPWNKTVVGIITNSDDRIPGILESFGLKVGPRRVGSADERSEQATLDDDVSFVVLSYDVGVEKPDRRMFDSAVGMLQETLAGNQQGLTADDFEKLYVGDELEKDCVGAEAAEWTAVLLDREGSDTRASGGLTYVHVEDKAGTQRKVLAANDLSALSGWQPSR
jgi:FMN phosphatase YigB (HAD superfamily)